MDLSASSLVPIRASGESPQRYPPTASRTPPRTLPTERGRTPIREDVSVLQSKNPSTKTMLLGAASLAACSQHGVKSRRRLNPGGGAGSARAHKVAGVAEAITGAGASVLYLPPYSPARSSRPVSL